MTSRFEFDFVQLEEVEETVAHYAAEHGVLVLEVRSRVEGEEESVRGGGRK